MTHSTHPTLIADNQDFKNQSLSSEHHPFISQIEDLIAYHPHHFMPTSSSGTIGTIGTIGGDHGHAQQMKNGFDVLVAKYRLEFKNSANYIEKIEVAKNQNLDQLKSLLSELSDFNERDYNIYIRPHYYPYNSLMVFDDYVSNSKAFGLKNELIYQKGINPDLMSLSFSLQTSINGDKKNYQLGFTLSPDLPWSQKSQFLTWACKELECDARHAVSVGKYFRAAGFLNKKFKEVSKKLEIPAHKNHTVLYHSYELKQDLVLKKNSSDIRSNMINMAGSINAMEEKKEIESVDVTSQTPQTALNRKNKF